MQPLDKTLRRNLEKTVMGARDVAEAAARAALEQLGVGEPAPYPHLTPAERELRRKLRIHGRQLGDVRDPKTESQEIDRLIEEVAYEHWHRMLFARFLAENDLLMLPDRSVSISLKECEDLSEEEGVKNGWELASRYAAKMLPQIFRPDSPVFELVLPPEHELKLEKKVADLPPEVFTASDSIGWVYQFWQAKKKKEVNDSGVKIGARELPSQTQLFTEPYMVSFLLDNSLGAWWAARRLSESDLTTAKSEEELRQKASLPGVSLTYLRFVRDEKGRWTPAAGTFDAWPKDLKEFKVLDPCCGSGHFLVAALLMLVPIRMEIEKISARDAIDKVIHENLHGLEIDHRCVELAAFAVALTSWNYPNAGGYRQLPEFAIACSGHAVSIKKEEWLKLAGNDKGLEFALDTLYDQFSQAPILGSLIDPATFGKGHIITKKWDTLGPILQRLLSGQDTEKTEMGVLAQGISRASSILSGKYHWIITNVPYLVRSGQSDELQQFCEEHYNNAKNDLATVFLSRCLKLNSHFGVISIVLPQNWLFLTSNEEFRYDLLKDESWRIVARLGPGAFETISGEVVKAILFVMQHGISTISKEVTTDEKTVQPEHQFLQINVSYVAKPSEKARALINSEMKLRSQEKQLINPGYVIELEDSAGQSRVTEFAFVRGGITTGDSPRYRSCHWEHQFSTTARWTGWEYQQSSVKKDDDFAGREFLIFWEDGKGKLVDASNYEGATIAGRDAWGKKGIAITYTSSLKCSLYSGNLFENIICVMVPRIQENLVPVWCFCNSDDFPKAVRSVNQKLSVDVRYFEKAPIDFDKWKQIAAEKYPDGLPKPHSDDPTQWIFHGHPAKSESPLQVAIARLLCYRWPAELDPEMELSDDQRAWVKKCDILLPFADDDGIVCIPSIRGEPAAADRLLSLLAAAYGDKWSNDVLAQLLTDADHEGKTLETWLRDKFFLQHCKLFQNRPFIWQIWDGLRDGFSVLVNYHMLDHKTLQTLIYTYLGDWISRQKHDIEQGIDGAQERLDAAEVLKKRLELILQGETPYDIFVRWKPLDKQPIGWNPDLNDGIRLNIRPFLSVPDVGKKGAGVLRDKPNIKWEKDRGQDVESAPWYNLGPEYGGNEGDRINDHHLKLEEKKKARGIS